jgi:hypothetical protein
LFNHSKFRKRLEMAHWTAFWEVWFQTSRQSV